jgi:transcriptional regulator with XRE-family HTH domain
MHTRTETNQILRRRIKYHRTMAGVQQKDLAAALGVKVANISNIERGVCKPDVHTLREICHYLKIPLTELLEGF